LTIAGSDSSGGAGIQADLKVFSVMGVFGSTAITAVTAQNTTGVKNSLLLTPEQVDQQIDAVAGDLKVDATKTGMLGNAAIVETVAKAIKRNNLFPFVLDPVMVAKSGDSLIDEAGVKAIVKKLVPIAAVVTPNRLEAGRLLGSAAPIGDVFAATEAARQICSKLGARACVIKGIKRPNDQEGDAVDVFAFTNADGKLETKEVVSLWRITNNTHGSGCTFSAAITAGLALGKPLDEAVQVAKNVVSEAIRQTTDLGHGNAPVNHLAYAQVKK